MNSKINVLELELHNDTAKEAMQKVMDYMQTEPLNIVELISSDSLLLSKDDEVLRDNIGQSDLVLTVEKSFLELAGVTDRRRLQEAESGLFLKMVLHYFHKNHVRVFLLAESQEDSLRLQEYFENYYAGIEIVGVEAVAANREIGRYDPQQHQWCGGRMRDFHTSVTFTGSVCCKEQNTFEHKALAWTW